MLAADHFLTQGDTLPAITGLLKDGAGVAYDLTSCTVQLAMRSPDPSRAARLLSATVVDAVTGSVSYAWTTTDTAEAGDWYLTWRVTTLAGAVLSFPADRFLVLRIAPTLGAGVAASPVTSTGAAGTFAWKAVTTTYQITGVDFGISCTAGPYTVTLPTATGCAGQHFEIANLGAGVITLAGLGGQLVDAAASQPIYTGETLYVRSTGTAWEVV